MAARVSEKPFWPAALCRTQAHGHRFGGRRCLIQQRGVGQLHARQIHDHLLEIEQTFQPALGDFRLIGRVRRVPGRILEDIALHHRGHHCVVVALADQRTLDLVLLRDGRAGWPVPAARTAPPAQTAVLPGGSPQAAPARSGPPASHNQASTACARRPPGAGPMCRSLKGGSCRAVQGHGMRRNAVVAVNIEGHGISHADRTRIGRKE